MSFNNGTYVLPAGQPVAAGTVISSATFNNYTADVGNTFNLTLPRDGQAAMTGQFKAIDGSSTIPGISFNSEASTGIYKPSSGILGIVVTGNEALRINSSGRILVATSSDDGSNKLQVAGGITSTGFVGPLAGSVTGSLTGSVTGAASLNVLKAGDTLTGSLTFATAGSQLQATAAGDFLINASNASGNFVVRTNGAERLRIDQNGNVGLGVNPAASVKLFMNDGVISTLVGYNYASNTISGLGTNTSHALGFLTNGAERMRLDISGNLGINKTPSGNALLDVNGTSSSIQHVISDGGSNQYGKLYYNSGAMKLEAIGAVPVVIATNGAEVGRFDTLGNLLMGSVTCPYVEGGRKLLALSGTTDSLISFQGGDYFWSDTTGSKFELAAVGSSRAMAFVTNGAQRAEISPAGNFLIGTVTDAGPKLQVNGAASIGGSLSTGFVTVATAASGNFITAYKTGASYSDSNGAFLAEVDNPNGTANYFYQGITNGSSTYLVRADGEIITNGGLTATGNVLIGTSSDNGSKLQVNGQTSLAGTVTSTANESIRTVFDSGYLSFFNSANTTRTGYIQGIASSGMYTNAEVGNYTINSNSGAVNIAIGGSNKLIVSNSGTITDGSYNELGYKGIPPTGAGLLNGQCYVTTGGFTVPTATAGYVFCVFNNTTASVVLSQGSGLVLRQGGTSNSGNRNLLPYGFCTIWYQSSGTAIINGNIS